MYGRILGFQRLARWPKWTPASINSFTKRRQNKLLNNGHTGKGPARRRSGRGGRPAFGSDIGLEIRLPKPGPIGLGVAL